MVGMLTSILTVFILAAISIMPVPAQQGDIQDVCVGPWEWITEVDPETRGEFSYWQARHSENLIGLVDLRSIPQMSLAGGAPQGAGLFAYNTAIVDPSLQCFGSDLNRILTVTEIGRLELALGLEAGGLAQTSLRRMPYELLTTHADPTGQTFARPLRGKLGETVSLRVGDVVLRQERFNDAHRDRTVAVFQADYRRNKAVGVADETLRRWTGHTMIALYGRASETNADRLMPSEHRGDGWERPETIIGDTFVDTLGTELASHIATGPNGGFGWTMIRGATSLFAIASSDRLNIAGNDVGDARADRDLSSDDHYAQIVAKAFSATAGRYMGVMARKDGTATATYYHADISASTGGFRLFQVVTGTFTQLGSGDTSGENVDDVIRLECEGSSIRVLRNGAGIYDVTNTTITGSLRTGIVGRFQGQRMDDFEAADLAAEEAPAPYGFWMSWPLHAVDHRP